MVSAQDYGSFMKWLLSSLLIFTALGSSPAYAARKVLDCNIGFGDIAQVQVFSDVSGFSFRTLTRRGVWLKPQVMTAEQWSRQDFSFRFDDDKYRIFARAHGWDYEVTNANANVPSIFGTADCR